MSRHITLVGAGLTGPLLAIYLSRRGYSVDLYERRPDMRVRDIGGGRSINLALSTRGIHALQRVGAHVDVLAEAIAMPGRMIHSLDGELDFQPYGKEGEAINSISRGGLNITLLNLAEREPGVKIHFSARCSEVAFTEKTVTFTDDETGQETTKEFDLLISAEGAGSRLREVMERDMPGFSARTEWLEEGYKELEIPPGNDGGFLLEPNALHIWPRHDFMMIALPNPNATFTCTLFAPFDGPNGFDTVESDSDVTAYMTKHFPDAVGLMPTLLEDWKGNPTSRLGTLFASPWYLDDSAMLIGDAAHAIVPFYGQGMNACFEDCLVLDSLMSPNADDDWGELMPRFFKQRKPSTDAIAELAVANFLEMRSKVVDPDYLRRKSIDTRLNAIFPDRWISLYSMVTFSTIPYDEARDRARSQDTLLSDIGFSRVEEAIEQGSEAVGELLWGEKS